MGIFSKKRVPEPEKVEPKKKPVFPFGNAKEEDSKKNESINTVQRAPSKVGQSNFTPDRPTSVRPQPNSQRLTDEQRRELSEGIANMKKEIDENPEAREAFSALGSLFGQAARGFANMVNEAQQESQRNQQLNSNTTNTNSNDYKKGYQDGYQDGFRDGSKNQKETNNATNDSRFNNRAVGILDSSVGRRLRDERNYSNLHSKLVTFDSNNTGINRLAHPPYTAKQYDLDLDPGIISYLYSLDGTPFPKKASGTSYKELLMEATKNTSEKINQLHNQDMRVASSNSILGKTSALKVDDMKLYAKDLKMSVATSNEDEEKNEEKVDNFGKPTVKQWDNPDNPFMANKGLKKWFMNYFELDDNSEDRGYFVDAEEGKI